MDEMALPESFVTHSYTIRGSLNETFYLIPFGDVHRFSPLCADDRWLEFLHWAKSKPRAYFIGMGDYTDLLSTHERKGLAMAGLHESTEDTMEEYYESLLDKFEKEIGWMRGKLIGLLEGNHRLSFLDGTTSTQRLCRRLGCKYLGNQAFIKLNFVAGRASKSNSMQSVTILATHGISQGGRTIAGGMAPLEKLEWVGEADLYLMGHNHQKGALPFARLHLVQGKHGLKVVQRKGFFVRTGSFLRGWVPDRRSYVASKLMRPTDLGCCKIELTPHRDWVDGVRGSQMDIHVSI